MGKMYPHQFEFFCFLKNLTAPGDSHDIEENLENDTKLPSNER